MVAVQDVLPGKKVERITFTEVNQKAVEKALASPRQIDNNVVDAYMARRILDRLLGYDLSAILRCKLGGAKSAGTYPTSHSHHSASTCTSLEQLSLTVATSAPPVLNISSVFVMNGTACYPAMFPSQASSSPQVYSQLATVLPCMLSDHVMHRV